MCRDLQESQKVRLEQHTQQMVENITEYGTQLQDEGRQKEQQTRMAEVKEHQEAVALRLGISTQEDWDNYQAKKRTKPLYPQGEAWTGMSVREKGKVENERKSLQKKAPQDGGVVSADTVPMMRSMQAYEKKSEAERGLIQPEDWETYSGVQVDGDLFNTKYSKGRTTSVDVADIRFQMEGLDRILQGYQSSGTEDPIVIAKMEAMRGTRDAGMDALTKVLRLHGVTIDGKHIPGPPQDPDVLAAEAEAAILAYKEAVVSQKKRAADHYAELNKDMLQNGQQKIENARKGSDVERYKEELGFTFSSGAAMGEYEKLLKSINKAGNLPTERADMIRQYLAEYLVLSRQISEIMDKIAVYTDISWDYSQESDEFRWLQLLAENLQADPKTKFLEERSAVVHGFIRYLAEGRPMETMVMDELLLKETGIKTANLEEREMGEEVLTRMEAANAEVERSQREAASRGSEL